MTQEQKIFRANSTLYGRSCFKNIGLEFPIKRVLVMENVADRLAELIKSEVEKLTVGNPFDNADITPLIDNRAADFIEGLIEDAQEKGAKALTQIKREKNLLWPVLFDHVTLDMRIAWEEPFGPILPLIRIKSLDEAIEICNGSEYGLQTSVFTKNIVQAFDIAGKGIADAVSMVEAIRLAAKYAPNFKKI